MRPDIHRGVFCDEVINSERTRKFYGSCYNKISFIEKPRVYF
jgi:hypothetical protein